mmetsp:Transcript_18909/g.32338  ORF Transcript_18909/g.32338 Transcript_18909/m.32338 type:complete len:124 (+) Transcript_18909:20-391(+)|eukprot:CAMPEP_0119108336 /NCGR_PEP_ID=MMETSP1180-20130426/13829_1 /TAXON_ID=3052 ORGANISM="Chlamydomonas cf sp, Strain CCMP681" /NCGR_SAMPLE_ID=MMETSP1180 /ASSEMBLY_ACC=CAM_ASM_000741 /LENGTH=123 /DNA_ID=CAMNT_0007093941 /DNA_START=21 /DNA_END=392 /DNA_ORIENTATION=+
MVQIARTNLPPNQVFHVALGRIFGLGRSTGLEAAEACGISKDMKVRDVKEETLLKVAAHIQETYVVGDQLKRSIRENILAMIGMGSYRGRRHELGLSISGHTQTNNTNAKKLKHHVLYDTSRG